MEGDLRADRIRRVLTTQGQIMIIIRTYTMRRESLATRAGLCRAQPSHEQVRGSLSGAGVSAVQRIGAPARLSRCGPSAASGPVIG